MNAQDKAKELVEKYVDIVPLSNNVYFYAKQCAIIAVDETIKALRKDLPEIGLGKGYWYAVKKEIEKL